MSLPRFLQERLHKSYLPACIPSHLHQSVPAAVPCSDRLRRSNIHILHFPLLSAYPPDHHTSLKLPAVSRCRYCAASDHNPGIIRTPYWQSPAVTDIPGTVLSIPSDPPQTVPLRPWNQYPAPFPFLSAVHPPAYLWHPPRSPPNDRSGRTIRRLHFHMPAPVFPTPPHRSTALW